MIMIVSKSNGKIIPFLKQKDYIMVNNSLGEGSFGKTVLLQDPCIDELFVAKKYEPENDSVKVQFYKNFLDEIKILYKLNHRNIVRIYNYYAYDKCYTGYILMEYIDGTDIGTYIRGLAQQEASDSLDSLFRQLIDAFCYIENHGIVHRDIRETNILVDKNGIVKVIDFGIGKIFKATTDCADSLMFQVNRRQANTLPLEHYKGIYTFLTDMFYIGELFYRLVDSATNCCQKDFSYNDVLQKMMQKDPEDRYSNFEEIKQVIGQHDFINNIQITDRDRSIYQKFTTPIYQSLFAYTEDPQYNSDSSLFISRLYETLKNNLFESCIQKNSDIINSIVLSSYRYSNEICIECAVVKDFLEWFESLTASFQELVMTNIAKKLSLVHIDLDDDLPF